MLNPDKVYTADDITLLDDGTLDTVVRLPDGTEWRYGDIARDHRDEHGTLDMDAFCRDVVLPDMDADPDLWS